MKKTHFYKFHCESGAKMGDFANFEMPIWYDTISSEHIAVRESAGLFDVTHMGRIRCSGNDVELFLNYMLTNDVSTLHPFQVKYAMFCNRKGGIEDDILIYRLEDHFLLVCNAANTEKDFYRLKNFSKKYEIQLGDITNETPMIAVQGPNSQKILQKLTSINLDKVKRFYCAKTEIDGIDALISRTGYTGEDGFELILSGIPLSKPEMALNVWSDIINAGAEFGIKPCGLGARDSLRIEAGLPLYGNELTPEINPFEAKRDSFIEFQKPDFIGRESLIALRSKRPKKLLVNLRMLDRGIPRSGYEIWKENVKIGYVTSGSFSPLLKAGIGLGYMKPEYAKEGNDVLIKIRDKYAKATVTECPLYDIEKYGFKRRVK